MRADGTVVAQTEAVSTAQTSTQASAPPFGALMREWRRRRRLSQLELAIGADVSSRHVSFIETGRSAPSRAMVLRLATTLGVPLREQNQLLLAAGLAPEYSERSWEDPELAAVRAGVERVLDAHELHPCLVVDREWNIVRANAATALLLDGVAPELLEIPNALRIALHPNGLARRIENLAQWRHHLLERLRRESLAGDRAELRSLLAELEAYPAYPGGPREADELGGVAVPLRLVTTGGEALSLLSMVSTFGTALDLTVAELSIEAFLPADPRTARFLADAARDREVTDG